MPKQLSSHTSHHTTTSLSITRRHDAAEVVEVEASLTSSRRPPPSSCCSPHRRTLLLSEGLAVLAKPEPGSSWRGPGQLSGGQVALVGLALNFATQAVRPAPLYLMDEVRKLPGP